MTAILVVDAGPFAWTLGRVEAERLVEVRVVDRIDGVEETLFRARLTRLVPEIGGAFVDVGGPDVLARLPASLRRARPAEGTTLLVQGTRDATFDKPARATAAWRVAGRLLDLRGQGGAPTVDDAVQGGLRRRLRARALDLLPGRPVTLRASAATADDEALRVEAAILEAQAQSWRARAAELRQPGPVTTFDERLAAVRRGLGLAAGVAVLAHRWSRLEVARRLDLAADAVGGFDDPWAAAGVAEAWAVAHEPEVPFGDGARLFVEPTRACIAIDVDRGASRANAAAVDAAAAEVLAEAIAVRQLGGQIVVDFLEPGGGAERAALEARLLELAAASGTRLVTLMGSGLAILERPRRTAALHERASPLRDAATALLQAVGSAPLAGVRVASDVWAFLQRSRVAPLVDEWLRARAAVARLVPDPALPPMTFVRS